jgi:predicted MFS family arabinose efflux permease
LLAERERIVRVLVAQVFLIFFQGFMIAPLLPRLSVTFHDSLAAVSALVPAYMLPYGCVCLLVGPLADRLGRAKVLRTLMFAAVALPALTATASSLPALLVWRALAGIFLGGITPVGLALISELFPYRERGRPVGWMFGAIAGGMAAGATAGPLLEGPLGWRGLFLLVALLSVLAASAAWAPLTRLAARATQPKVAVSARTLAGNYLRLLGTQRGATVYALVLVNGAFHGGVFAWLGVYFVQRYALSPQHLGLALLGYGIPGFLFGPLIGRLADRFGRRGMVRLGLVLAGSSALALAAALPVLVATLFVTLLSAGFDLTHPLFAGIISALDPTRTAQAMALNAFAVFIGMGTGSVIFGTVFAHVGLTNALLTFGLTQLAVAAATLRLLDASWR